VFDTIDASPLVTIAAIHGVCFGGGLELALTCDLIIADKMARFCFPELRLGLIPGGGGTSQLKRDLGNAVGEIFCELFSRLPAMEGLWKFGRKFRSAALFTLVKTSKPSPNLSARNEFDLRSRGI
jgi:hypothetical protein